MFGLISIWFFFIYIFWLVVLGFSSTLLLIIIKNFKILKILWIITIFRFLILKLFSFCSYIILDRYFRCSFALGKILNILYFLIRILISSFILSLTLNTLIYLIIRLRHLYLISKSSKPLIIFKIFFYYFFYKCKWQFINIFIL